jgi:short-subunit dehydrogenase
MRRWVVITGATGGLGRAFVWEFASRGWDLFLTDRSSSALEMLASGTQRSHGVQVRWQASDLSDSGGREELVAALSEERLRPAALVNVAGFDLEGAFIEGEWTGLLSLMRVNMEAGLFLTHAIVGLSDGGEPLRVINTASLAAFFPMPYKALYSASKGFILSSSLALREELRGRATITVLCPAGMPTTASARESIDSQGVMGRLTTMNTSEVARITYRAAMHSRPVVVPGFLNRSLLAISRIVPKRLLARIIGQRWGKAGGYANTTERPLTGEPSLKRLSDSRRVS